MRSFLPPLVLLGVASLAVLVWTRAARRSIERRRAEMPDATVEERSWAAVEDGEAGKQFFAAFAVLTLAATGAIWLVIVLIGHAV